jgi:hypothetical protein
VALSKAFALAAASEEARAIREEVGFFQAIRAALVKSLPGDSKKSSAERELAIQQLVSRAVVSTEIVDIMKAAGLDSPDISILSDEFLAEVRDSDKKNFAIEALKKLINGNVRSQSKRNVTHSKVFSGAAGSRYEMAVAIARTAMLLRFQCASMRTRKDEVYRLQANSDWGSWVKFGDGRFVKTQRNFWYNHSG